MADEPKKADQPLKRLWTLYDTLIRAMHAAHTQPSAQTRAKEH